MKRIALLCVLLLLSCSHPATPQSRATDAAAAPQRRPERIVLGLPVYGGTDVMQAWEQLAEYLKARLGISVGIRAAEPYVELPRLLRQGAVDIAQLPPLAYVQAHAADNQIRPLLTAIVGSTPTYLGHLYVRADSRFQTVEDLRGARMAYVDLLSSSGYLFPRDLLRSHSLDPDTIFSSVHFYQSHAAVLAAVVSGEADVGAAIDDSSGWAGIPVRPEGLRVIAKTQRIPNDCVAARADLDPRTASALQEALLALHLGDPEAQEFLKPIHLNGWVRADEARYEQMEAVLAREASAAHK